MSQHNIENSNSLNENLREFLNSFAGKVSHRELLYVLMIYVCESALECNPKEPIKLINETAENAMKVLKQMKLMK